ncbi:hypothetical protein FFT09_11950 [Saccharomonospora piscinae]|uniref:hypothetical protein n=1 Tax=Saccharomonospora piscinae TaxID=687388 RepID=UPI0011059788|nr:hypothetical protein [Saccharomonospora piscinae]TLW91652.1 hypothetical protein FFT09_11950 [Saccharomonospora piscinae]
MSEKPSYGSRPDLLPQSLVKVVRASAGSGRLLEWVGRAGLELLDASEDTRYQRESLDCFTHNSDGLIAWGLVDQGSILYEGNLDNPNPLGLIKEYAPDADIAIILWSNVLLPSVKLDLDVAQNKLPELARVVREFWIYLPVNSVIIEHAFHGSVTVARVRSHR